ncbi:hypothetical protein PHYBOEH_004523 [Phytophthora boehmeriae]|uniref:XPA C-terminal domain-containing protein n=1 Tax=Phytophthora boehmeriae TaxID=109152 RepID=A0A8T1WSZ6_9STRA|nr:hypothetical protein PHYBOEH_004523 [Phytophthora boehmeriae]
MPPSQPAAAPDLSVGRCDECKEDSLYLDPLLLEHFSLSVCVTCKQDQTLRTGAFELLSKARARAEYALPDSAFCGLAHLAKPNPHHEAFAPLQLYLRRALLQEAYRLYGGEEGLQREKQKRKKRAFRSAAGRTKHLLKRKHLLTLDKSDGDAVEAEKETTDKQQKKKEYVPVADRDHKHAFSAEEFDQDAAVWVKKCGCGMQVQFEKW